MKLHSSRIINEIYNNPTNGPEDAFTDQFDLKKIDRDIFVLNY